MTGSGLPLLLALPLLGACVSSTTAVGGVGVGSVGEPGDDVPASACLDATTTATLAAWLATLTEVARAAPDALDADAGLGLFQLPGVSPGPWFLLDVSAACDEAPPSPFCADGVCYTAGCADDGWTVDATNDAEDAGPTRFGEWAVADATVHVEWHPDRGAEVSFAVGSLVADTGADWRFTGSGTLAGALTLDASFPALGEGVEVTLVGGTGMIASFGFPVAAWDAEALTPVEDCGEAGEGV